MNVRLETFADFMRKPFGRPIVSMDESSLDGESFIMRHRYLCRNSLRAVVVGQFALSPPRFEEVWLDSSEYVGVKLGQASAN